jgi:hypothetical protein
MLIQKYAVYEGVLHGMSGGRTIEGTGGGVDTTIVVTEWSAHARTRVRKPRDTYRQEGWTRREFVDVGETRIRNLAIFPYDDELLQEAVGQQVAISVLGPKPSSPKRHALVALRTPRAGVERLSRKLLFAGSVWKMLKYLIVAPFLAFALLIPVSIVGAVFSETAAYALLPVVALLVLAYLAIGLHNVRVVFKASAALDGPADGRGAYYPA